MRNLKYYTMSTCSTHKYGTKERVLYPKDRVTLIRERTDVILPSGMLILRTMKNIRRLNSKNGEDHFQFTHDILELDTPDFNVSLENRVLHLRN